MAFSSGVYTLAVGNPVVTGTVISSTTHNNTMSDIATGLSTAVLKDGTQTITANIPMSTFKLTGLGAGSASGDSLRYEQLFAAGAGGNIILGSTGLLNSQSSVTGVSNTADTNFDILVQYTLPANSLSVNNKRVRLTAWGAFANNANAKSIGPFVATTQIGGEAGGILTAVDWVIRLSITRVDVTHVNLLSELTIPQLSPYVTKSVNFAVADLSVNTLLLSVKGRSDVAGAAGDVTAHDISVEFLN